MTHCANLHALGLTHVLYSAEDIVGQLLAYISLVPILLFPCMAFLGFFVREFHIFLYFIGMLANTIMNEVLKELMKEPRPHGACKDDYGMPSNHAQSIFFFAAYWSFLFSRHVTLSSALTNRLTAGAWWLVAVAVAYSRVHLGYHSNAQVAVGAGDEAEIIRAQASSWRFSGGLVWRPFYAHMCGHCSSPVRRAGCLWSTCGAYKVAKGTRGPDGTLGL